MTQLGKQIGQTGRIKVLCVDDESLITMAMELAIDEAPDMVCVGFLGSADELVDEVIQKRPDVVLLDLRMPGLDPLVALEDLTAACPDVRTIVFTGWAERERLDRAIAAGAWGFLQKNGDLQTILGTIRKVAAGQPTFA
ncbi:MAG TPA: response regulator transcription factor [Alphaproteobacteria bacterium]|nr:response regulator transcription factor [Alphaproteobacteria bacterium]